MPPFKYELTDRSTTTTPRIYIRTRVSAGREFRVYTDRGAIKIQGDSPTNVWNVGRVFHRIFDEIHDYTVIQEQNTPRR